MTANVSQRQRKMTVGPWARREVAALEAQRLELARQVADARMAEQARRATGGAVIFPPPVLPCSFCIENY